MYLGTCVLVIIHPISSYWYLVIIFSYREDLYCIIPVVFQHDCNLTLLTAFLTGNTFFAVYIALHMFQAQYTAVTVTVDGWIEPCEMRFQFWNCGICFSVFFLDMIKKFGTIAFYSSTNATFHCTKLQISSSRFVRKVYVPAQTVLSFKHFMTRRTLKHRIRCYFSWCLAF